MSNNYYLKQKVKMQINLMKIIQFCTSAIPIVDRINYQESLYMITKMVEKMRKDSTYLK